MKHVEKAAALRLLDFRTPQMRAFHMAWFAFFLCFFGWFGIAPLMPVIREELHLTKEQIGNTIIASVAITVLARLLIGYACDRFGPRRTYAALLVAGALPVMGVGFANDYYIVSDLPTGDRRHRCVVRDHAVPYFGDVRAEHRGDGERDRCRMGQPGWRRDTDRDADAVRGVHELRCRVVVELAAGDGGSGRGDAVDRHRVLGCSRRTRRQGQWQAAESGSGASAPRSVRLAATRSVWALAVLYAACFGMELTIDNIAALYFVDTFHLSMGAAGIVAGTFGMMNIFARALGGIVSDWCHRRWGLNGRTSLLGVTIALEGVALVCFAMAGWLPAAIGFMLLSGLFIKMSNGATYAVVPFVNRRALGAVAGIVGAGGNVGAVLAGFLFKTNSLTLVAGDAHSGHGCHSKRRVRSCGSLRCS